MIDVTRAEVSIDGVGLLAPTSMSVGRGEIVALRGPNGAGKTTALRLIVGQTTPSAGTVTVSGRAPRPRDHDFRAQVAGMIGLPPFARDLTLLEQATLIGITWGLPTDAARSDAGEVLDQLGMSRLVDRFPHELSSGQTQLAGLALTLVRPADIVVLDEPEQRLDDERLGRVISLLRQRADAGGTVVFATHSDRLVADLGARTVVLREAA